MSNSFGPHFSSIPSISMESLFEISYSENEGRFVRAKQDIDGNIVLLQVKPYAHSIFLQQRKRYCYTCLKFCVTDSPSGGHQNLVEASQQTAEDVPTMETCAKTEGQSKANISLQEPDVKVKSKSKIKKSANGKRQSSQQQPKSLSFTSASESTCDSLPKPEIKEKPHHPHRCVSCDTAYFCSPVCENIAMSQGHPVACGLLKKIVNMKVDKHTKSILALTIEILRCGWVEIGEKVIKQSVGAPKIPSCQTGLDGSDQNIDKLSTDISNIHFYSEPKQSPINFDSPQVKMPLSASLPSPPTSHPSSPPSSPSLDTLHRLSTDDDNLHQPSDLQPLPSGNVLSSTFADFWFLQSHLYSWSDAELSDWSSKELKKFVKSLSGTGLWEVLSRNNLSPNEDIPRRCIANPEMLILDMASRIESNGFGIYNEKGDCVGRAIVPFASFFNHSCSPNLEPIHSTVLLSHPSHSTHIPPPSTIQSKFPVTPSLIYTFKTTHSIPKHGPITIQYVDVNSPVSRRREALRSDYYFDCNCERCLIELKQENYKERRSKKGKRQ
ncbi:hypothetical protein BKA69DRAFT_1087218 [Paraphysoderma sedebokerense]|nr:hypothetical protein BKA69DRAFT_1087218 [Paraphysoderma sedebokerense]